MASAERGTRRGDRIRLAPYTRAAIQVGVAVGASIFLGDLVSGRRFYWAVIAAFITFMGVNNSGEQARKGLYRIAGTVVGIGIGSLLATAVGHRPYWSIAVILVSAAAVVLIWRRTHAVPAYAAGSGHGGHGGHRTTSSSSSSSGVSSTSSSSSSSGACREVTRSRQVLMECSRGRRIFWP